MTLYFVEIPVETSQSELADKAVAYWASKYPNWVPHEGNGEVVQIESIAPMAQNSAEVAAKVPPAIFREFGTDLMGIPYGYGSPAYATTRWTLSDSEGHTIPADTTQIAIGGYAFVVSMDVVVPKGSYVANYVPVTAVDEGAAQNGLNTGSTVELISGLDWVDLIEVDGASQGGSGGEDDVAYQNRVSEMLTLMAPRPITADDFAVMARYTPGVMVGRSTAIDGYNPANNTYNNEKCVAVYVTAPGGGPLDPPLPAPQTNMDKIDAFLEGFREVNFIVTVNAPKYDKLTVTTTVMAYAGYDQTDLDARVEQAILDFYASFGTPPQGDVHSTDWVSDDTVRKNKVIDTVGDVSGVNYVDTLTITGTLGTAQPNGDWKMPGPVALPATDSLANATVNLP